MTNLFDLKCEKYNSNGPNFTSRGSEKNIACVGQKINEFKQNDIYIESTQI